MNQHQKQVGIGVEKFVPTWPRFNEGESFLNWVQIWRVCREMNKPDIYRLG